MESLLPTELELRKGIEIGVNKPKVEGKFDELYYLDFGDLQIGIDNFVDCCENFGILNNTKITYHRNVLIKIREHFSGKKGDFVFNQLIIDFYNKKNKFIGNVIVYNDHNGYYTHKAYIFIDGEEVYRCIL